MLIGHKKIQQQVSALAEASFVCPHTQTTSHKLPHALLIHGPKGIGKRTLCHHIAHFLICGGTYEDEALKINTQHPAYAQLQAGAYPDLHILERAEKAATINVADTRHLLERLTWTADDKRIVIIDSLDELNPESANALLKTLEEPAQNTHFLLVCHQISKILPTVLSRCQKLAAEPLTKEETQQVLTHQNVSPEDIETMLHFHPTSPGQGMEFGQTGIVLQNMLEDAFVKQTMNLSTLADKIAQKKQVPQALDLLLKELSIHMRKNPEINGKNVADTYQQILSLKNRQNTHNLSANWVFEEACTHITKLQSSGKVPLFFRCH